MGARNYDPSIGRFFNYDPLSEKYAFQSAYAISVNNPVFYIDINGEGVDNDYSFDKKTGDIKLVKETTDTTDRIVKTNSKGEVKTDKDGNSKVEIDGIAKGILKDGMNLKTGNNVIDVGGTGKPSLTNVEDFLTEFSNFINKELSGAYLSNTENSGISKVYVSKYENNTETKAKSDFAPLVYSPELNSMYRDSHFHTHPYGTSSQYGREQIESPSILDKDNRNPKDFKNYILLSRTEFFPRKLFKINYTND